MKKHPNNDKCFKNDKDCKIITVGEITGVHGVRGGVKIRSFAESSAIFSTGISFYLNNSDNEGRWYKMANVTHHSKGIIAIFEGINRDIAETLVGAMVAISKSELPELEKDTYYWEDLIGITVIDRHLGYLGKIDYILPTGSNDVFVVKNNNNEVLVPALSWVVLSVELDKKEMFVDLPEGLK